MRAAWVGVWVGVWFLASPAGAAPTVDLALREAAAAVVGQDDVDGIIAALDAEVPPLQRALAPHGPADARDVRSFLAAQVARRLQGMHAAGVPRTAGEIEQTVVRFEAFKARSFVSSGVFPKTYFGFVDGQGDTASLELRFARAVRASTDVCNAWLAERGHDWRVTDQEIAVTWIAEGGALLLSTQPARADRVHPILGIGLDDIAHGFKELEPLVRALDAEVGTDLAGIPTWDGGEWGLSRHMTFEETITGTAAMWVWEKQIAHRKLLNRGRPGMEALDATDQFIVGSLVYNSGILHSPERPQQVRDYALVGHLSSLAAKYNPPRRHAHLPVPTAEEATTHLLVGQAYPDQYTSWIALYHVLQRYGGYDALSRYTDVFDESGTFRMDRWDAVERRLAAEARAPTEAQEILAPGDDPVESTRRACGCSSAGHAVGWTLGIGLLALVLRRRD